MVMTGHLLGLCRCCLILGQSGRGKTCIECGAALLRPLLRSCRFSERRRGRVRLRKLLHGADVIGGENIRERLLRLTQEVDQLLIDVIEAIFKRVLQLQVFHRDQGNSIQVRDDQTYRFKGSSSVRREFEQSANDSRQIVIVLLQHLRAFLSDLLHLRCSTQVHFQYFSQKVRPFLSKRKALESGEKLTFYCFVLSGTLPMTTAQSTK